MMALAYTIAYIAAYLATKAGHNILSGIILLFIAIALYAMDYLRTKNIFDLRGLFALSFVGGEGVACLKLSYLDQEWCATTWICFYLGFIMFYLVFELLMIRKNKGGDANNKSLITWLSNTMRETDQDKLSVSIIVLTLISLICFTLEAVILGYIPLFVKGVPHAYSYFHISGVHYFTVSCVQVPALSVIWFLNTTKDTRKNGQLISIIVSTIVSLAIPMLCVSRFQFIFAVALALITFVVVKGTVSMKLVLPAVLVMIGAFAVLSVARSHDAKYLNSIFEMKIDLPVDISRIYIYIANNYNNFDCMVKGIEGYTWGLKMLFPVWALTGLKFVFPQLVDFPLYITKTELTTLTLFYDFYYDFGIAGVFFGSALIGAAAYIIKEVALRGKNKVFYLIYSQMAIYMGLAFFTTWFSNPTTLFYLAVTIVIILITSISGKKR